MELSLPRTHPLSRTPFWFQGGDSWGQGGVSLEDPQVVFYCSLGCSRGPNWEELSPCPCCCWVTARWQPRPVLSSSAPCSLKLLLSGAWEGQGGQELENILLSGQRAQQELPLSCSLPGLQQVPRLPGHVTGSFGNGSHCWFRKLGMGRCCGVWKVLCGY